eukprot:719431-Amphidinium_carterae.1
MLHMSPKAVRGRQVGFEKAMIHLALNSGLASQASTCAPPSEDGVLLQENSNSTTTFSRPNLQPPKLLRRH